MLGLTSLSMAVCVCCVAFTAFVLILLVLPYFCWGILHLFWAMNMFGLGLDVFLYESVSHFISPFICLGFYVMHILATTALSSECACIGRSLFEHFTWCHCGHHGIRWDGSSLPLPSVVSERSPRTHAKGVPRAPTSSRFLSFYRSAKELAW